jgi:hypothetical protein
VDERFRYRQNNRSRGGDKNGRVETGSQKTGAEGDRKIRYRGNNKNENNR